MPQLMKQHFLLDRNDSSAADPGQPPEAWSADNDQEKLPDNVL